ncbi:MAG TPA: transposase [Xenococcaceae cyanobacterium]
MQQLFLFLSRYNLPFVCSDVVFYHRSILALKTISSREIRKEFAQQLKPYYWKPRFWKQGYGYTSSGDAPIEILIRYIENQGYKD